MSSTSVLHMLNHRPLPGPFMPVDMTMRICLAHSPPVRSFLSSYEDCRSRSNAAAAAASLRPCISTRGGAESAAAPSPSGPLQAWASTKPGAGSKKKVVFADSKGMSLTNIHVFKEFEDDPLLTELQFDLADLKLPADRGLVLDFPQPAADYLDFRNRLKQNQVCLENCTVQERTVAGTVKVRNVCFEKSVSVRISLDAWKSHRDAECTYMNNVYGCPDTDTFAFSLDLPDASAPQEQVEFCIRYQTRENVYWDNNNGVNYRLVASAAEGEQSGGVDSVTTPGAPAIPTPSPQEFKRKAAQQMDFDRFGSPRTSSGFFPEWQSWGRLDTTAIYW